MRGGLGLDSRPDQPALGVLAKQTNKKHAIYIQADRETVTHKDDNRQSEPVLAFAGVWLVCTVLCKVSLQ